MPQRTHDVLVIVFLLLSPGFGRFFGGFEQCIKTGFVEDRNFSAAVLQVLDLVVFGTAGSFCTENQIIDIM